MSDLGDLGFWIFVAVVWYCDYRMYVAGHDTLLFTHKTKLEKKLRDNEVGKL